MELATLMIYLLLVALPSLHHFLHVSVSFTPQKTTVLKSLSQGLKLL